METARIPETREPNTDPLVQTVDAKAEEAAAVARSVKEAHPGIVGDMEKAARMAILCRALGKIIAENAGSDPEDVIAHVRTASGAVADAATNFFAVTHMAQIEAAGLKPEEQN